MRVLRCGRRQAQLHIVCTRDTALERTVRSQAAFSRRSQCELEEAAWESFALSRATNRPRGIAAPLEFGSTFSAPPTKGMWIGLESIPKGDGTARCPKDLRYGHLGNCLGRRAHPLPAYFLRSCNGTSQFAEIPGKRRRELNRAVPRHCPRAGAGTDRSRAV